MSIAVVVPTIRDENHLKGFLATWKSLFEKHRVECILIQDGDDPTLTHWTYGKPGSNQCCTPDYVLEEFVDCFYPYNRSCCNLGFAYIAKELPDVEYILTFDDDVAPYGDTIQDHLDILQKYVPTSWISTASEFMRGFPYSIRQESRVMISHGVWEGVYDYDAPTQLVRGNPPATFYKGPVPKGIFSPFCGMNVGFHRDALPAMYYAPMGRVPGFGFDRFDDIFVGIMAKRWCDENNFAMVTGYSTCYHTKASNVFTNLKKEALGLELNEGFWKGEEDHPYFPFYRAALQRWLTFLEVHGRNIATSTSRYARML